MLKRLKNFQFSNIQFVENSPQVHKKTLFIISFIKTLLINTSNQYFLINVIKKCEKSLLVIVSHLLVVPGLQLVVLVGDYDSLYHMTHMTLLIFFVEGPQCGRCPMWKVANVEDG